jgi:hypothetical protein
VPVIEDKQNAREQGGLQDVDGGPWGFLILGVSDVDSNLDKLHDASGIGDIESIIHHPGSGY